MFVGFSEGAMTSLTLVPATGVEVAHTGSNQFLQKRAGSSKAWAVSRIPDDLVWS